MKAALLLFFLLAFSSSALADFSTFPDDFAPGNTFNGYLVVGRQGSSQDVIGQNLIGLSIARHLNAPQEGINKLDDEVSLDNNLILIGSPCVNTLTAELLGNPEPCDRDFLPGTAFLKFMERDGYVYVLVAGYSDVGTRLAAKHLADFNVNLLRGTEIRLEVEGEEPAPTLPETDEADEEDPEESPEAGEEVPATGPSSPPEQQPPEQTPEPLPIPEKISVWKRFLSFLSSIFS